MKSGSSAAPPPAPTPAPPEPVRVPQTDDPDVAASIRRKMQEVFANKRGRAAADLTSGNSSGATNPYSRDTLG